MENKDLPNCVVIYDSLTNPNDVDIKMVNLPEKMMKVVREMPDLTNNVPPSERFSLDMSKSLNKVWISGLVIVGSIGLGILAGFAINKLMVKHKNKHSSENFK